MSHSKISLLLFFYVLLRSFVALVIVQQPFPMVLAKGKALEEPVVVQVLTGANVAIQSTSLVKVHVSMDSTQPKGAPTKHIDSDTECLDTFDYAAKFHLKFLNGTRKNLATVKFSVQLQLVGGLSVTIESNPSSPFVAITNECQYEESDGLLLKTDAFEQRASRTLHNPYVVNDFSHTNLHFQTNSSVTWPLFANLLQRHFLRGSRQDAVKPQRFLSKPELYYLNQKFFGKKSIEPTIAIAFT